jgi:hypothetical protein
MDAGAGFPVERSKGIGFPVGGGGHGVLIAFFKKKNENKMTRGKKTEEGRMQCACVEGLICYRYQKPLNLKMPSDQPTFHMSTSKKKKKKLENKIQ